MNRNFSPEVLPASYDARYDDAPIRPNLDFLVDSAHIDSIPAHLRAHWLGQVDVEGKRVFIYSLPESQSRTPKGYRRTHFTGYSFPEDYAWLTALMDTDLAGADYRRTLYWNPAVPLDTSGRATLSFKNNSTSRHMTVSAMGFTPDGRPVSTW